MEFALAEGTSSKRGERGRKGGTFDTKLANYCATLRATPGKHIWMMGGGELIASFLDAGEIDEFDIHVIPTLIGEGIPLVASRHRDVPLRLRSARKYPDGVVRLRYEVSKVARHGRDSQHRCSAETTGQAGVN